MKYNPRALFWKALAAEAGGMLLCAVLLVLALRSFGWMVEQAVNCVHSFCR